MASKHRAPTRNDHHDFCMTENWEVVRGAKGKPVKHHVTFKLVLNSGNVLRTRISRPVNNDSYGPGRFKEILRDQLQVTVDDFWACVNDRVLPDRGGKDRAIPENAISLGLVMELRRLGVSQDEINGMDPASAANWVAEFYAKDRQ